ncbi:MAG: sugar ABC transporter permease [Anaerolineales bacterium]|nr:sugar ABC transporter permease [Anaerolineales bacterium]
MNREAQAVIGLRLTAHRQYMTTPSSSSLARRRERWFYLLITPWLVGLLLFQVGPIVAAVALSFVDWPLPQPPQFVGLTHFQTLLGDPLFGRTLLNTAYYAVGTVPTGILLGLGLALLVERPLPGITLFRTVFFLPVIASGVAMVLLWGWMFNARYGLINTMLAQVGIRGPAWLQDAQWAMPALILMSLWGVGTNMLIYLAALQGVPTELHEAASLDGAGRWSRFRHVTWPLISPVTLYLVIVNVIGSFQVFTPTYILTRGGPENATLTLPLYIYFNAFSWNKLGYAATLSLVLFLVILLLTLLQFRLARGHVFYRFD